MVINHKSISITCILAGHNNLVGFFFHTEIVHARVRIKTSVKCSGQIVHARVRIETSVKWSGKIVHSRVKIETSVKCSGQIVHARVKIETSPIHLYQ
jgi:uncharacterized glyoxalase superfamily protein PhnB